MLPTLKLHRNNFQVRTKEKVVSSMAAALMHQMQGQSAL